MKCPYCEKEYNKYGIKGHIWRTHTEEGKAHDTGKTLKTGEKIHWAKGKTKHNNASILQQSNTLKQNYKEGNITNAFKDKHHNEQSKEILRQKRFDYLSDENNISTFTNRHKRLMSKGESIINKMLKDNSFYEKYSIINEYPIYPYFIDFAFVDQKIAIEYDGEPHFTNGLKRVEHDMKKDNFLRSKGWRIYRIPYYELKYFTIEKLLDFINCPVV